MQDDAPALWLDRRLVLEFSEALLSSITDLVALLYGKIARIA